MYHQAQNLLRLIMKSQTTMYRIKKPLNKSRVWYFQVAAQRSTQALYFLSSKLIKRAQSLYNLDNRNRFNIFSPNRGCQMLNLVEVAKRRTTVQRATTHILNQTQWSKSKPSSSHCWESLDHFSAKSLISSTTSVTISDGLTSSLYRTFRTSWQKILLYQTSFLAQKTMSRCWLFCFLVQ